MGNKVGSRGTRLTEVAFDAATPIVKMVFYNIFVCAQEEWYAFSFVWRKNAEFEDVLTLEVQGKQQRSLSPVVAERLFAALRAVQKADRLEYQFRKFEHSHEGDVERWDLEFALASQEEAMASVDHLYKVAGVAAEQAVAKLEGLQKKPKK